MSGLGYYVSFRSGNITIMTLTEAAGPDPISGATTITAPVALNSTDWYRIEVEMDLTSGKIIATTKNMAGTILGQVTVTHNSPINGSLCGFGLEESTMSTYIYLDNFKIYECE